MYSARSTSSGLASAGYQIWACSARTSAGSVVPVSGRSGSVHSTTVVPTAYLPVGVGKSGMGKAIAAPTPAMIARTPAAEPGPASHQRIRRPPGFPTMVRAVNGSTTTTATSTGTICQRRSTTASTAADANDTAAAPIATRRRNRGGSQRANTSANAPSTRPASIGVTPIPLIISFTEAMVTEFGSGGLSHIAGSSALTSAQRLIYRLRGPCAPRSSTRQEVPRGTCSRERQLREQFGLRPGAPCRAFVESQHGPAALYLITEAKIVDPT
jgi:hypothetical protein